MTAEGVESRYQGEVIVRKGIGDTDSHFMVRSPPGPLVWRIKTSRRKKTILSGWHHFRQFPRIAGRIAVLVVVEIAENLPPLALPGGDGPGPAGQGAGVVIALVRVTRAVQPHVDEIRGYLFRGK